MCVMRRKLKKGFMEVTTSNPDLRNIQIFTRKRSKRKGIPGRGNSTGAAYRGFKRPQGWGVPSNPAWLQHTVYGGREMQGHEEETAIWGETRIALAFRLYSTHCDELPRGFGALSAPDFREITARRRNKRMLRRRPQEGRCCFDAMLFEVPVSRVRGPLQGRSGTENG